MESTRDAFLDGRLTIAQPLRGFRAGLDSVLLGAAAGRAEGALLDLGAGSGVAALVALTYHPGLAATLVEADAQMAALAAENAQANGLAERVRVAGVDVTASGRARSAAGLKAEAFASVIANPPFFAAERGTRASSRGAQARQMSAAALDLWVKTAAAHAAPGGETIFIHVAEALAELLTSMTGRFGAITVLPLTPREGEPAHRILVRGIKGSRAPLTLLGSRALHLSDGRHFRAEFEAILRGRERLHW
ncbi:MAG TPA: methyltransferase [Devosia sp.]|nr:methyltransferase [Devosia sp.]